MLLQFVEELSPYYFDLSMHVCGSHVLRALLCVLGGVKIPVKGEQDYMLELLNPANRTRAIRGKKARKKKAAASSANGNQLQSTENDFVGFALKSFRSSKSRDSFNVHVPVSFELALKGLAERVMNSSSVDEDDLLKHPSAGPLITMLLQVLILESYFRTFSSSNDDSCVYFEPNSTAEHLVYKMLHWEKNEETKRKILFLSSDSTGKKLCKLFLNSSSSYVQFL